MGQVSSPAKRILRPPHKTDLDFPLSLNKITNPGVASLLAILLKEKHPKLPIECWAFGCPGVLSLNLARKVPQHFKNLGNVRENFDPPLSFMQCFSAGEDNIPRLSHGSILDLTSMVSTQNPPRLQI